MNKICYFAVDGNYGNANHLVLSDTSKWTDKDWNKIEEASDDERAKIASKIAKKHKSVIIL